MFARPALLNTSLRSVTLNKSTWRRGILQRLILKPCKNFSLSSSTSSPQCVTLVVPTKSPPPYASGDREKLDAALEYSTTHWLVTTCGDLYVCAVWRFYASFELHRLEGKGLVDWQCWIVLPPPSRFGVISFRWIVIWVNLLTETAKTNVCTEHKKW